MLINKYDTCCNGTQSNRQTSTSVVETLLNILANNYVVIRDYDLFNESTLFEVTESLNKKKLNT